MSSLHSALVSALVVCTGSVTCVPLLLANKCASSCCFPGGFHTTWVMEVFVCTRGTVLYLHCGGLGVLRMNSQSSPAVKRVLCVRVGLSSRDLSARFRRGFWLRFSYKTLRGSKGPPRHVRLASLCRTLLPYFYLGRVTTHCRVCVQVS